jgi:trehalose synthase-fused probable maltokinase
MTTPTEADKVRDLETWLCERRWYGEKTRFLTHATTRFQAQVDVNDSWIRFEVRRLSFDSGPPADYLLILDSDMPDADGVDSPVVRSWLIDGFTEGRTVAGTGDGALRFQAEGFEEVAGGLGAESSRVFRGEQSNTSVVYGDRAMLKLFRKLREGINPEVEIGRFLTGDTAFTAFPRLYGTIDLHCEDGVTTVAALQEYIPSVGDAWDWITQRIADESIRPTTIEAVGQLGRRTGEMHRALATGTERAFVPEVASAAYAEAVHVQAVAELRDTVAQLTQRGVDGAAAPGDALEASLSALHRLQGTMITRIHGDYHLGQVLRTSEGDFAILDFEGEPTRPLSERRAKASPLRDVAGMLRSFDYAAETGRRAAPGNNSAAIDAWYEASRASFLQSYYDEISGDPVLARAWDPEARDTLLAAFEVHKALYETRYELSNRPDWIELPLNALRRIAIAAGSR